MADPKDVLPPPASPVEAVAPPDEAPVDTEAKTCANCGAPATWRTTGENVNEVLLCDADKPLPPVPVEAL